MENSGKTILSGLDEEISKTESECERQLESARCCQHAVGDDNVADDSLFKSFFETSTGERQLESAGCCQHAVGDDNVADDSLFKSFFETSTVEQQPQINQSSSASLPNTCKEEIAVEEEQLPHVLTKDSLELEECSMPSESSIVNCQYKDEIHSSQYESKLSPNATKHNDDDELPCNSRSNCSSLDNATISVEELISKESNDGGTELNNLNLEREESKKASASVCNDSLLSNGQGNNEVCRMINGSASASEIEFNVFKSKKDEINGKENSMEANCTDRLHDTEEVLFASSLDSTDGRKPMCIKQANVEQSNNATKPFDPFTLSGDEDFSPKAYKPIKRKLNQGCCKDSKVCNKVDFNDDEKRQKVVDEDDLSLSGMSGRTSVTVAYVYSKELVNKANKLIRIEGRAQLVHSLIEVYGILQHVDIIAPRMASETEIVGFHSSEYLDFLKSLKDSDDLSDSASDEAEAYGLSYDCPLQENVFETASLISGATITAAESLVNGSANIAINWCGGWHHAKRDSASGFCYLNDIVMGILKLREKFDKVLYVDLDLHHGDGVEEAFYMTPKVMTISFHKYACGFFPGSGSLRDTGSGRGRLYSVNVPLMDGIGDMQFFSIFTNVMKKVRDKFGAEAIVIQCGADGLSEDPMASFNLTHVAIAKCVCFLLTWSLPTLLLGGGGYNFPNTAKCWTFLTAMAAGKKLPVDIPEHEHLMEYGPTFEMMTTKGNRKDCNTKEHFYEILTHICKNLNSI